MTIVPPGQEGGKGPGGKAADTWTGAWVGTESGSITIDVGGACTMTLSLPIILDLVQRDSVVTGT